MSTWDEFYEACYMLAALGAGREQMLDYFDANPGTYPGVTW